jgi:hypothetical protein
MKAHKATSREDHVWYTSFYCYNKEEEEEDIK